MKEGLKIRAEIFIVPTPPIHLLNKYNNILSEGTQDSRPWAHSILTATQI